jgi:phage terminase large subunit
VNLQIETTITYQNLDSSTARYQHHIGGTRSGKTYAILQWIIVQCLQKNHIVSIVRSTMPSLRRSVIKDLRDILNGLGLWEPDRWSESNKTYTFDSGAIVTFFSTDDEGKLRGIKADISWLEEASEIDADSAFQIGIRTTQKIIYSYNPTISPYHWLRQQYGDNDVDVFRTTYKDNPFIGKEQINAIEDLKTKNPKYWQIYGLGEFAGNERQIFNFEIYTLKN